MQIDFAETCAWLDLLYGDCDPSHGSIVIVAAARNRLVGIHPVGHCDNLVEAAKEMHQNPGCYAKINLMDADAMRCRAAKTKKPVVGCKSEVKTIVSLHLDVDAGKYKYTSRPHALWALENMPCKPTLVVNSDGGVGGFHAYWKFRTPIVIENTAHRKQIQSIADRWNVSLKTLMGGKLDSTSNLDRILRCVGVPRKDGGNVCCKQYTPNRLYELDQF